MEAEALEIVVAHGGQVCDNESSVPFDELDGFEFRQIGIETIEQEHLQPCKEESSSESEGDGDQGDGRLAVARAARRAAAQHSAEPHTS